MKPPDLCSVADPERKTLTSTRSERVCHDQLTLQDHMSGTKRMKNDTTSTTVRFHVCSQFLVGLNRCVALLCMQAAQELVILHARNLQIWLCTQSNLGAHPVNAHSVYMLFASCTCLELIAITSTSMLNLPSHHAYLALWEWFFQHCLKERLKCSTSTSLKCTNLEQLRKFVLLCITTTAC